MHLTFAHNFGKYQPISKIMKLGNYVRRHYQDSPSHFNYVPTLPCES